MRRISLVIAVLLVMAVAAAQYNGNRPKFSPEKFQAELERFIAKEACLSPKESARFFPVYSEMKKKERALYGRIRRLGRQKPASDEACEKVIKQRDELDVDLKQLQQSYHDKFLRIIPASKLFDVIKAEDQFHRKSLRDFNHNAPRRDKKNKAHSQK